MTTASASFCCSPAKRPESGPSGYELNVFVGIDAVLCAKIILARTCVASPKPARPTFLPINSLMDLISGRASKTWGELVIRPATKAHGQPADRRRELRCRSTRE